MAFFKVALCLSVLVSIALALPEKFIVGQDINDCDKGKSTDKTLLKKTLSKDAKMTSYAEGDYTFPESGINDKVITCVKVTDKSSPKGKVSITSGGVDFKSASFHFKSGSWFSGYEYYVEIYGK